MILSLDLKKGGTETLQRQVFTQIRDQILSGRLTPGSRMPPSRLLATEYGISRNTVVQAYEWLSSEGYIETTRGVGTIVSRALPEASLLVGRINAEMPASKSACPPKQPVLFRSRKLLLPDKSQRAPIDFWPGRPNPRHFPVAFFRKTIDERIAFASTSLSEYSDEAGVPALRAAICAHLRASRGIAADPDQVLITAGIQEALNLIGRLFVQTGSKVVVEDPCYQAAALVFESFGANLAPLEIDCEGMNTSRLDGLGASIAYITPSHQFPTGVTLSLERRLMLLEWARSTGAYIVEDDYDSDYQYSGPPMIALAGLDTSSSVIYLGTFSKSIGAGLRTGYVVLPRALIDAARAAKSLMNYGHPWLEQITLANFLASGAFSRHLRRIRRAYNSVRDILLGGLTQAFGDLDIIGAANGMHVMWRLPPQFPAADALVRQVREFGVDIYTIGGAGAVTFGNKFAENGIVLGYSSLTEDEVQRGVRAIVRAVQMLGEVDQSERSKVASGSHYASSDH